MFYNIKEFSELINVSKQTLRNCDKNNKLKWTPDKTRNIIKYYKKCKNDV